MDARMLFLTFIALGITATVAVPAAAFGSDDFNEAIELVEKYKQTLESDKYCKPLKEGLVKFACQFDCLPTFGFLYCKSEGVELSRSCERLIGIELQSLKDLDNAGVRTIGFHRKMITDVLCPDTRRLLCAGLIVKWVDKTEGMFAKFPDQLGNDVLIMSKSVIRFITSPKHLDETVKDLQNIVKYMCSNPDKSHHYYNEIGDLQGFFLSHGGFLVSDPSEIKQTDSQYVKCRVEVLNDLINALAKAYT